MNNVILAKIDKMYGGYDYIEYDSEQRLYTTGCSRGHRGHNRKAYLIKVGTLKEIKQIETRLVLNKGFKKVDTLYGR